MKKALLLFFVIVVFALLTGESKAQSNWKFITSGSGSDWYLNTGTVITKSNSVEFWVKIKYASKKYIDDIAEYVDYKLVKYEINCTYNEFRSLAVIYNAKSGEAYVYDDKPSEFVAIPAGSIMEGFSNYLCK